MKNLCFPLIATVMICCAFSHHVINPGKPYKNRVQQIPGKLECEYYNEGGEGIAYHDTDAVNNGSGKLNPANGTFLNEFRMKEGVDISYTKAGNIDDNPYNKTSRDLNKLYVGWTEPGEWINYNVKVAETGKYIISLLYTANGNGEIAIDIDEKPASGLLKVASTHDEQDTVKWRQWHHWNKIDSIGTISMKKGLHTLKLRVITNGNMNFDYLDFKLKK